MSYVGAETLISDDWIVSALSANSVIQSLVGNADGSYRIFEGMAPHIYDQATPPHPTGYQVQYPFIVYQTQAAPDTVGIGPKARIMTVPVVIVRGVAETSFDALRPLAAAIDAALDGQTNTTAGGAVLGSRRNQQYRMQEEYEGRIVRHLGGEYTVWVQAF